VTALLSGTLHGRVIYLKTLYFKIFPSGKFLKPLGLNIYRLFGPVAQLGFNHELQLF
jgi:hypothetical protein